MIITDLETHLIPALADAEEVWIAIALITDDGFRKIRPTLTGIKQNYLIGINLPTDPNVLSQIKDSLEHGRVRARLANDTHTFHPKVYIIKKADKHLALSAPPILPLRGFVATTNYLTRSPTKQNAKHLSSASNNSIDKVTYLATKTSLNMQLSTTRKIRARVANKTDDDDYT